MSSGSNPTTTTSVGSEVRDVDQTSGKVQENSQVQTSGDSNPPKQRAVQDYCTIDGINYMNDTESTDLRETMHLMRNLNIRHDDIVMMGYPKSGNHWTFEILHMILHQHTEFTDTLMSSCFCEFLGKDIQEKLDVHEAPRVLCTHLRTHRLPKQVIEKRVKIVYIVRNPKDVAVSLYNMFRAFIRKGYIYDDTFNEYFDKLLRGDFYWGHWFDHVLSIEEFMKNNPDHPVFIVSYEKMKASPQAVIKELCAFLNKPDTIADGIAKTTEMSNMSKTLMSGKEGEFQKDLMKSDGIFRKGIIGDWKQWLTVSQSEAFDKLFQEKMSGSKLAPLVKQYI